MVLTFSEETLPASCSFSNAVLVPERARKVPSFAARVKPGDKPRQWQ